MAITLPLSQHLALSRRHQRAWLPRPTGVQKKKEV